MAGSTSGRRCYFRDVNNDERTEAGRPLTGTQAILWNAALQDFDLTNFVSVESSRMGIPGLINAIGPGERISLSKLAITHLEQTARPIRIAVDISIWLFQVQAGRGGRNPEIRTLFYRLLKFLALPVHPLFVYDGKNKPPFKRGKTISGHGNAPIIHLSKRLIDLFKFPRHEAPGEAEAECARLQRAGIVDAVMSNDVDAMMFGSTMTVMNFSKESGSGTGSASHVTCYRMSGKSDPSKVGLDRAGMVLFAMLSGGDYLPSGVQKCGSKLAAEIAKAGFGSDLLDVIGSMKGTQRTEQLGEWRERLQYELEENESGYFQTKHKAVRIPQDFPDQTVLEYYASPAESNAEELGILKRRLVNAWDQDIDPLQIRNFAAGLFDWNYRSGARKVVRLLAEPLVTYRLRLQKRPSVFPPNGPSLSKSDVPMLQKIYKTRTSYATDGLTELQVDVIPIDVVGLDLLTEETNPPLPSQETTASGDEEEDLEIPAEPAPQSPVKKRVTKRYDPYALEKMWIFEALAKIGIPDVVERWQKEKAEKSAPKKPSTRKTGPKKKGPIDPGMKRGSILKYGTVTKERTEISQFKQAHLFDAAISTTSTKRTMSELRGLEESPSHMAGSPKPDIYNRHTSQAGDFDDLADIFSSSCAISPDLGVKRHSMANRYRVGARRGAISSGDIKVDDLELLSAEPALHDPSPPPALPRGLRISYSNTSYSDLSGVNETPDPKHITLPPFPTTKSRRQASKKTEPVFQVPREIENLEDALSSLSLLKQDNGSSDGHAEARVCSSQFTTPKRRSPKKKTTQIPAADPPVPKNRSIPPAPVQDPLKNQADKMHEAKATKQRVKKAHEPSNPPPSSDEPPAKSEPEIQPKKPQIPGASRQETSGHVESITIHDDGSWGVEEPPKKKDETKASKPENEGVEDSRRKRRNEKDKKKRVKRVSILDLT